ncbi:lipopolysaccharide assembly protein LapB [Bacillus sp. FJAT-29814]|uniref:tetratricopeptide repeat protein n=1 Tax=Bacillus sp. FJAT-29814 TaxID=1729688 RepID=UPI0008356636|nr:tetratricopeptide repeat protein [Bacillus sp. FJAT-29814]
MSLRDKTLEELEEMEAELSDQEAESGFANYSMKIDIYKEMVRKLELLIRQRNKEYEDILEYVKRKLVFYLIHYGTYLKTEYQKDDHLAASCLNNVLRYDRTNPIAPYRLGFLSYKNREYAEAIQFFQKALENDKYYPNHNYKLNGQQQLNAHLYLTNSALRVANQAYENMKQLPDLSDVPKQEFSPLIENILINEQYLQRHAFYLVDETSKTTCSKADCENLVDRPPLDTLLLYFNDRDILMVFEEKMITLSYNQGIMIRHFLLKSSEERPATRASFTSDIEENSYVQNVNRFRNKLREYGFPPIIQNKRYNNETAYYYNGAYPYKIMYRVDDEIEYA